MSVHKAGKGSVKKVVELEEEVKVAIEFDFEKRTSEIFKKMREVAVSSGIGFEYIQSKMIRPNSLLYMLYWYKRLQLNKEEQSKVYNSLISYINTCEKNGQNIAKALIANSDLNDLAKEFTESLQFPQKTVDLVFVKGE